MDVAVMLLVLFVAAPVALGYLVPDVVVARLVWLSVGAVLAASQARDDELGGAWVLVAAVAVAGLGLIQLGRRLRER